MRRPSSREKQELAHQLDRLAEMERALPRQADDTPEMQARYGHVLGQTRHCLLLLDELEERVPPRHRATRLAEWKPTRDGLVHKEFVYEALSGATPTDET